MSDIFDAAERGLSADAARDTERKARQEAERRRQEAGRRDKEETFEKARQRLREVNDQISELYVLLKRSGIPPSKMAESRLSRLRGKLARPVGASMTAKTGGRGGWPLAEVAMTGRRLGAVGGNAWSGTQYGWRDITVGGQGIVLLTDGGLHEYRWLDSGSGLEIGEVYDRDSDLPPKFAVPQVLVNHRSGELIDCRQPPSRSGPRDLRRPW